VWGAAGRGGPPPPAGGQGGGEQKQADQDDHDGGPGGQPDVVVDRHLVADGQAQPARGGAEQAGQGGHGRHLVRQQPGGGRRDHDQGDHQDRAHGLDGGHHDQGDEQVEDQVEGAGAVAHGGRGLRVEGPQHQLLVEQGQDDGGHRGHDQSLEQVGAVDGQDPAEQERGQVGGEAAGAGDQHHPEGEERGEQDGQSGVVADPAVAAQPGQQDRRQDPEGQG